MIQRLYIPHKLPGFNEMLGASNRNRHVYNKLKKQVEWWISVEILDQGVKPIKSAFFRFTWHEKLGRGRPRDPDNICAGKKFVLDALQATGILDDDGRHKNVGWFEEVFYGDTQGVEIEIHSRP